MNDDLNLLFGVLAVQVRRITRDQLVMATERWSSAPSRDLPDHLVESGALSDGDRKLLGEFIAHAVEATAGDTGAALAWFADDTEIRRCFRGRVTFQDGGSVRYVPIRPAMQDEADTNAVPAVQESPGRYRHLGDYARGGMGKVVRVHDNHLGRDIALKELLPAGGAADSPGEQDHIPLTIPSMARFLQEARITGQLEHPSIVPVHEIGHRRDGTLYYTMKLVRGETLSQAIGKAGTLENRLKLLHHFVHLCQAIAYAHSRAIIHRDIKPANVMVGEFGETVVLDWGVAKAKDKRDVHADGLAEALHAITADQDADPSKTAYGESLGTPAYMSPEQAKGSLDEVDERSDIYSLGAVLYEVLTAHAPFEGGTLYNLLWRAMSEAPPPVTSLERDAPPELVAICGRAMQKDKMARYASAKELADEVECYLSGERVESYDYRPTELLNRFVRKHERMLATIVLATCVLLVGGFVSYLSLVQERDAAVAAREAAEEARQQADEAREKEYRAHQRAEREFYTSTFRTALEYYENGRNDLAEKTLWTAPQAKRDWEWGYLLGRCDPLMSVLLNAQGGARNEVPLERDGSPLRSAAFNADGTRLLTVLRNGRVSVWDAETLAEVASFSVPSDERAVQGDGAVPSTLAAVSPDGGRVVTVSHASDGFPDVRLWDGKTGNAVGPLTGHSGPVWDVAFSPDGALLVTASGDKTARLWDGKTGAERVALSGHEEGLSSAAFDPEGARVVTASDDGTATVWDARTGVEQSSLLGHTGRVGSATFSPEGQYVATGSDDRTARLWDAEVGIQMAAFEADAPVLGVAFSPEGGRLLVMTNGTNSIWDVRTREELARLDGGIRGAEKAPFSPMGTRVVTITENLARMWDTHAGREVFTFADVKYALFAPDGVRLLIMSSRAPTATFLTAAPFRPEMLPGDETMDWRARFTLYKKTRLPKAKAARR